jgi:hypothetical protein
LLLKALGQLKAQGQKVKLKITGNYHPSVPQTLFEELLTEKAF